MVAVIINTYNDNPDNLRRAVESYRFQDGVKTTIIISTIEGDPVMTRPDEFADCIFSVLPLSEHPGKSPAGAYAQINRALKWIPVGADWFCYASGNDWANPNKLALEIKACEDSGCEVCYSDFTRVTPDGRKIDNALFFPYDYKKHLGNNFVSDCSLISMRLVKKYLPYLTEFGDFAHWDSWLRMYEGEGNIFVHNPIPTWNYVIDPDSMSRKRQADPQAHEAYLKAKKEFYKTRKL